MLEEYTPPFSCKGTGFNLAALNALGLPRSFSAATFIGIARMLARTGEMAHAMLFVVV
jgi:hypothetical protein